MKTLIILLCLFFLSFSYTVERRQSTKSLTTPFPSTMKAVFIKNVTGVDQTVKYVRQSRTNAADYIDTTMIIRGTDTTARLIYRHVDFIEVPEFNKKGYFYTIGYPLRFGALNNGTTDSVVLIRTDSYGKIISQVVKDTARMRFSDTLVIGPRSPTLQREQRPLLRSPQSTDQRAFDVMGRRTTNHYSSGVYFRKTGMGIIFVR